MDTIKKGVGTNEKVSLRVSRSDFCFHGIVILKAQERKKGDYHSVQRFQGHFPSLKFIHVTTLQGEVPPTAGEVMNFYVILLLLFIQGLALGCCEEYKADNISGEGSWDQGDWSGSGDTSTGENDNFTGFDSGSSSTDKGEDDGQPKFYPRISQTHSNRNFVTSGVGEDKGGSRQDGWSHDNSEKSGYQENTNEDAGSSMDLSKVGEAIDVMKRLKKAKSDQEFTKKLRSGPESLGVAFKTFEQLSGLWISVMHRIWRVWKAKGAKVVMHSIVNDIMHNTGRAITQKLGKMLNNTIDVRMNSSGSAVLDKDDGSTEPEQKHRTDTVHHQADLPVQKVSIDFIKNVSNTGRKSSQTKPFKEPSEEKVKVSFLKRNMNESKPKLKPETDNSVENTTFVIQKTLEDKENSNVTSIREKSQTRSTSVPKITLPVSLSKGKEQRSSTNKTLVTINKDTERSKSDARKVETQKGKQHLKKIEVREGENNSSEKSSGPSLGRGNKSRSVVKLRGTDNSTQSGRKQLRLEGEKPAVEHAQSSAITKATNDNVRDQNDSNSFFPQRKVSQNEVNASLSEKERVKKTGKAKMLETMRISFFNRNKTSLSDPKTTLSNVIGPETRGNTALPAKLNTSNTPLHQKSNSKTDSLEESTLRKSTSALKEEHKETYPTGKKILTGERNQTNEEPDLQRDKNSSRKGPTGNNRTTISDALRKRTKTPQSAKSENIVIKMNRKEGASGVYKANDTVNQNVNVKATETHKVNKGTDIYSMQQNVVANLKTRQINETNPVELTSKGTDDNSVRQQVKSSTINVERKEERSGSLTSTNFLTDQKRLDSSKKKFEESKVTSEAALTASTKKQTFDKEKIFINRANVTNSERDHLSNSQNDGIAKYKKATPGDVQRTLDNNSRIIVKIKNKKQMKQNSQGKLVDSISSALKKETQRGAATSVSADESQQKIIVTLQKLGNSKGTIRNVKEEKTKQDSVGNHSETQKDQTNEKSKSLENTENIEIKPDLKSGEPSVKETSSHAPDFKLESKDKTGSESYVNDTQHSHGNSITNKEEKHRRSFSKKILVSHEEKSDKPENENRENAANGPVKTHVTQSPGKGLTHESGNGSKDYSGSSVIRDSGNDAKHGPRSGANQDLETTTSDLLIKAVKHHSKHVSNRVIVQHKVSHSPQQVSDAKSKQLGKPELMSKQPSRADLESVPPQKDTKHELFNMMKMSQESHQDSQASRKTKEERPPSTTEQSSSTTEQSPSSTESKDHQLPVNGIDESAPPGKKQSNSSVGDQSPTKENEKSLKPNQGIDDKVSSSKLKSSSPGMKQTPAKEEKKSSKTQQVEVLTSRTPPTSLLTTSNDDNTYSIKQIVQGPRGSSYVYGIHNDDKVHNLEKKVSKLESEVIVLETAMADLAKRLLVVEQNSEVPRPTMPTTIHSSIKSEPDEKQPVHSQQTNVYVSKDEAPKLLNPEKIVIPISSLFSERADHENKPSHSIHEIDGEQETRVENRLDNEDQGKSQDTVRLSLRGGAQSSPSSEAHAVVRPIVNIIVPNNKADLFPDGVSAACIPRCQNGGRCLEGNTCRCPTFFKGDHCERFSLKDLLESSNLQERPHRKLQRIVVSEPPEHQILDGALNLDPGPPTAVEYKGVSRYRDINQDILPAKEFVAKQQPTESTLPINSAEIDGGTRRQLILEI
ncbi:uncharacterized protein LOC111325423 [Stylophora pistillata]|uniref:uncharacterized protein LOC111325423 n=1 Tax=Stylophora pistillata TaxID=50429 RepID=UPI000C052E9B|nr:uncharacterized protein LOC111325423 [Stylophora pistillata]